MSYATHPFGDPFDKALEDMTQALAAYQQNIAETLEALEEIAATETPAPQEESEN